MTDLDYIEQALLLSDPEARVARFRGDSRLRELLPEVYRLEGVPQPPDHHPEGDAFVHTLLAVRQLPPGCDRRLAWAALLHDVGKADTTQEIAGRIRAFDHDRRGSEQVEAVLLRLAMTAAVRDDVVWLVRHHMFALSWQVREASRLTRHQRRFIADPRFPLLLALMEIDAQASLGSPEKLAQLVFYRGVRAAAEQAGE